MKAERLDVLVFHRALGFVHRSIPVAVEAIVDLGARHGFDVDATDDPDRFEESVAARDHQVVAFVHTSGNVLPEPSHRRALEAHLANGGGFVGVHAASAMGDVATEWPWYRELVGASFKGHTITRLYADDPVDERPGTIHGGPLAEAPPDADRWGDRLAMWSCEPAVVHVEDPACPAIDGIADGDVVVDEWYGFHDTPRSRVNVVATVDESTYEPYRGEMGVDHPIVWWHEFGGGRSVYNSMGHSAATWRDERFLATIVGGIRFAAGGGLDR
jgi:hypothetical protein